MHPNGNATKTFKNPLKWTIWKEFFCTKNSLCVESSRWEMYEESFEESSFVAKLRWQTTYFVFALGFINPLFFDCHVVYHTATGNPMANGSRWSFGEVRIESFESTKLESTKQESWNLTESKTFFFQTKKLGSQKRTKNLVQVEASVLSEVFDFDGLRRESFRKASIVCL